MSHLPTLAKMEPGMGAEWCKGSRETVEGASSSSVPGREVGWVSNDNGEGLGQGLVRMQSSKDLLSRSRVQSSFLDSWHTQADPFGGVMTPYNSCCC